MVEGVEALAVEEEAAEDEAMVEAVAEGAPAVRGGEAAAAAIPMPVEDEAARSARVAAVKVSLARELEEEGARAVAAKADEIARQTSEAKALIGAKGKSKLSAVDFNLLLRAAYD